MEIEKSSKDENNSNEMCHNSNVKIFRLNFKVNSKLN